MDIPLPQKPKIVKEEKNVGIYEIDGLYPGYGITIGNTLRRVLLSSIPGSAVTAFRIKGAKHEFSTIPGVKEDGVEIMLNVKRLRFKLATEKSYELNLRFKGAGEVNGKSIELPAGVELINPETHIATVTDKKSDFEMVLTVESGIGFQLADSKKKNKADIDTILIDASFTPLVRVNFTVENTRVGDRTDFNKLMLEIETDGTISPRDALLRAVNILLEHLQIINESRGDVAFSEKSAKDVDISKLKIQELNLAAKYKTILDSSGIKTIGGLIRKSESDLSELENLGEVGVKEVKRALAEFGLYFKEK